MLQKYLLCGYYKHNRGYIMEVNTIKAGNKILFNFINDNNLLIVYEGVVLDVEYCAYGDPIQRMEFIIVKCNNEEYCIENNDVINIIK